jgi:hypothetical protein
MKNIPTTELLAELQKRDDIYIVDYLTPQNIQKLCEEHNLKISLKKAKVVLQKIIQNEQFALDYGLEVIYKRNVN